MVKFETRLRELKKNCEEKKRKNIVYMDTKSLRQQGNIFGLLAI